MNSASVLDARGSRRRRSVEKRLEGIRLREGGNKKGNEKSKISINMNWRKITIT